MKQAMPEIGIEIDKGMIIIYEWKSFDKFYTHGEK